MISTYLSVTLMSSLIGLSEVELDPVSMLVIQLLHQVHGALAQGLTDGVKEHKDQVS